MRSKTEKYIELSYVELNLDDEQIEKLARIGLNMIKDDTKYLVDYIINKLMGDIIFESGPDATEKQKIDTLKEKVKISVE